MSMFKKIKRFLTPDPEIDFQLGLREETFSGNYAKAAWLYQKAIDRGHEKAKYFLAQMYPHWQRRQRRSQQGYNIAKRICC
jgi:TPR repeat protein